MLFSSVTMWVTSLGLAGEAGIFASLPFYPMFSGVPNGPLRLSPPQVHAAVHNSGNKTRAGRTDQGAPAIETKKTGGVPRAKAISRVHSFFDKNSASHTGSSSMDASYP